MKAGRLHVRLDEQLVEDIKGYTRRRGVTLTVLVQQYFLALLEEERRVRTFDAEQI